MEGTCQVLEVVRGTLGAQKSWALASSLLPCKHAGMRGNQIQVGWTSRLLSQLLSCHCSPVWQILPHINLPTEPFKKIFFSEMWF